MCKTKSELDKAVAKYRKAASLKKKLEAQLASISEDITEYVISKGEAGGKNKSSLVVVGDDYKISYITSKSQRLDNDLIKGLLGDSLPEYQKEVVTHRLDVR